MGREAFFFRPAMLKKPSISALPLLPVLLMLLFLAHMHAAGPREITVYAPQTTYQVSILDRDGDDYVGLTDLLEPLGHVESQLRGKKFTLFFNGGQTEFHEGEHKVVASGVPGGKAKLDLGGDFVIADGRGYIPLASVPILLPRIVGQPAEFHAAARRLFVGSSAFHLTAELLHGPSRLLLSFPVAVNPSVMMEKGRVHLVFHREPLVGNASEETHYNDPFVLSTSFLEQSGEAEFVAIVQQPATVAIAEDGRTVTIASLAPPPAPPPPAPPSAPSASAAPAAPASSPAQPVERPRPFVILDPAHGGKDNGVQLTSDLLEKNVTLSLARRLQKELESRGIAVVLLRTGDTALADEQRAQAANASQAAIYLGLHAASTGHGVRIYTAMLAPAPAQDRHSFVPWEQAQASHLQRSQRVAAALAAECGTQGLQTRSLTAPLQPLNHLTLAAVSVELAPQSSKASEVADPDYQQKVAQALANAVASLRSQWESAP
jgi:N-acetylmuramoyl-L-alanine amidase